MQVVRVGPLPESALPAAAEFHARVLPGILTLLNSSPAGEDVVLIFGPAPHDHRGWRLAVVQDLARAAAPLRVNGIVGVAEPAIARTLAYFGDAPGITGQLLAVDGKSGETR